MPSTQKVFIFESPPSKFPYSSPQSVADLKDLLSSTTIFDSKPDVATVSTFNFNMTDLNATGLQRPLIVVPGGSTIEMSEHFRREKLYLDARLDHQYHFLGVCAGASIASQSMDMFWVADRDTQFKHFRLPNPRYDDNSLEYSARCVNLIYTCKSIGPFVPDDTYKDKYKNFMAYRVHVDLVGKARSLQQLYIMGPGFIPQDENTFGPHCEVVGYYRTNNPFTFCYPKKNRELKPERLAAMVRAKPTPYYGAKLLTGTHIESCVPDSKLLAAFKQDSSYVGKMPEEDFAAFEEKRVETHAAVEELMRETFRP